MPKRAKQHEIDEMAQRVFKGALPPSWVVNPLTPDYAKDFLVEVAHEGDVIGRLFIVQLKGKQRGTVRKKDNTLTVPIERDHLRYYLERMPLPVFVVAADVSQGKAYFTFAHTPRRVHAAAAGCRLSRSPRARERLHDRRGEGSRGGPASARSALRDL